MTFLRRALADEALLARFLDGQSLPKGYGEGLDERVVEYPWVLARLDEAPGRLLDAGSTLNFRELLSLSRLRQKTLHIVTLAPESRCNWGQSVSYLFADLRHLPIRDDYYDEIVCISTLEHVGLDNSQYTGAPSAEVSGDFSEAVRELKRVLKPGGFLWVTVPYGRPMVLSWQQQFDSARVEQLRSLFQPAACRVDVYAYSAAGWCLSSLAAAAAAEYFDVRSGTPIESDHAAAARAVACIEMRK